MQVDVRDTGSIPGLGRFPQRKARQLTSSILAWRIPDSEDPGGPWGHKESDTTEPAEHAHTGGQFNLAISNSPVFMGLVSLIFQMPELLYLQGIHLHQDIFPDNC